MADISKCDFGECPSRESCYRFTAPANQYRQAFLVFCYDDKAAAMRREC